jgi:EAL domain-containing protein (putative c-di-GMP-specific phosphodiesterase class I)
VTETATLSNLSRASKFIRVLKNLGCYFALDDFGSGLSTNAYLKQLPVDFLKIDGMFLKDIDTNQSNFSMVKSINKIGHVIGIKTIAEFVESESIMKKLDEIGIDYAQGYYINERQLITNG